MAEIYLFLLFAICFCLLAWGLIKRERVYQYPFFMGGIFTSFILPQAIALNKNPWPVSPIALERVLFMSCLCAFMCWLGYQVPTHVNLLKKLDISLNYNRLLQGGILFILIGYLCSYLISQLPEEVLEQRQWTGIVTVYVFFGNLIFPGFMIILLCSLKKINIFKFILLIAAASLPLQIIVLNGRRESTATFIITIGLSFYYLFRYTPPRWLVISLITAALLIIPLTGTYRDIAKSGEWNKLLELNPIENLLSFVEEGKILELKNGALIMDASITTRQYAYGTDYWNLIVFRFIPAQFLGEDFKSSLMVKVAQYDIEDLYNYNRITGTTTTGIGDAFVQFDYLGCLFFFLVAMLFKNLWISANYRNSMASQIFYVSMIAPAMLNVTHSTARFFPDIIFRMIFIGGVIVYSRQKKQKTTYHKYLGEWSQD